jgi:hypothetical protein
MRIFKVIPFLALLMILFACKKSNNSNGSTVNCSTVILGQGKCFMALKTHFNFSNVTTFSVSNTPTTSATLTINGTNREIRLFAQDVSGASTRSAELLFILPNSLETSTGNIVGDFGWVGPDPIRPILVLRSNTTLPWGGSAGFYESQSGILTITCLSTTEIKGTFTNGIVQKGPGEVLSFAEGVFEAKF